MAAQKRKRPHPVDVHVGLRIRHFRRMIDMSLERLGEQIGVSYQQLQKYETGANRVGASRLHAIASELGVPVELLFEGSPKSKRVNKELEKFTAALSSRDVINLTRNFLRIEDPKVRRKIIGLVGQIADLK